MKASGSASVHRRRLSAPRVVRLVIALALNRHQSINWTLRYPQPMCHLSITAPSPRRGSTSPRPPWRGRFTNRPQTGLRKIRRTTTSSGSCLFTPTENSATCRDRAD
ncbi:hypothetical protein [Paraburkholderia sp. BL6665CI2N2]|uniref:hypothetical protein n=1 Tax=Paraburkholderia sp. BL6665CI2N2 TaxID=1938806 RepID=UPI001FBAFB8B|nr:hypothetical protein [Paraburkholderia sp. BL6665CI2N2]